MLLQQMNTLSGGIEVRGGAVRLVDPRHGVDHTDAMRRWAERRAADLEKRDLCGYVLKKDSPSCGMERVRVYPERGGAPRRDGVGLFVRRLRERLPLLPVEEEGRLHDPLLRESFIERIFAYARWKALLAGGLTRGGLVAFHTAHKLALLARIAFLMKVPVANIRCEGIQKVTAQDIASAKTMGSRIKLLAVAKAYQDVTEFHRKHPPEPR